MLTFILLSFALYFVQSASNLTIDTKANVIYLDRPNTRSFFINTAPQFYFARQNQRQFILDAVSNTFVKVPGLSLVFYNDHPRLFRISIQGQAYNRVLNCMSFVKIMIDEHILIANKLFPNTDARLQMIPIPDTNLASLDWQGGIVLYGSSSYMTISSHKRENVYLPAGVHSIDMVVRTDGGVVIEGFELSVEVNDIPEGMTTNLPLLKL